MLRPPVPSHPIKMLHFSGAKVLKNREQNKKVLKGWGAAQVLLEMPEDEQMKKGIIVIPRTAIVSHLTPFLHTLHRRGSGVETTARLLFASTEPEIFFLCFQELGSPGPTWKSPSGAVLDGA
ncbi:hypothetical protein GN956_G24978 [Arapaima gigas]